MRAPIFLTNATGPSNSATNYIAVVHGSGWISTETIQLYAPHALTLDRLKVTVTNAPGVGKSWVFTIRKNGADTGVTVTISDTATTASDFSNKVAFAQGDLISLKSVPSGTPATPGETSVTFEQSAIGMFAIFGRSGGSVSGGTDRYLTVNGVGVPIKTGNSYANRIPIDCTIRNLYAALSAAPGAGTSKRFTVYKNFSTATSLTALISDANTNASDTSNTVSFSAGNHISFFEDRTGTPATSAGLFSLTCIPVADSVSTLMSTRSDDVIGSSRYTSLIGSQGADGSQSTEAAARHVIGRGIIRTFAMSVIVAPGSGQSWTFTLRKNGADTALTVTIADTATEASITGNLAIEDTDLLAVKADSSASPAAAGYISTRVDFELLDPPVIASLNKNLKPDYIYRIKELRYLFPEYASDRSYWPEEVAVFLSKWNPLYPVIINRHIDRRYMHPTYTEDNVYFPEDVAFYVNKWNPHYPNIINRHKDRRYMHPYDFRYIGIIPIYIDPHTQWSQQDPETTGWSKSDPETTTWREKWYND